MGLTRRSFFLGFSSLLKKSNSKQFALLGDVSWNRSCELFCLFLLRFLVTFPVADAGLVMNLGGLKSQKTSSPGATPIRVDSSHTIGVYCIVYEASISYVRVSLILPHSAGMQGSILAVVSCIVLYMLKVRFSLMTSRLDGSASAASSIGARLSI